MLSVILLQDEFLQQVLPKVKEDNIVELNDERLAVLAISYHNLGVEFEHLKRVIVKIFSLKNLLKFIRKL